jgi:hypothetical protein
MSTKRKQRQHPFLGQKFKFILRESIFFTHFVTFGLNSTSCVFLGKWRWEGGGVKMEEGEEEEETF